MYVGRPSRWGNPYLVCQAGPGQWVVRVADEVLSSHPSRAAAADAAVCLYRQHAGPAAAARARTHLGGRDLACWCLPELACHAAVLLELVQGVGPHHAESLELFTLPPVAPDPVIAADPVGADLETSCGGVWGTATASFDEDHRYRFRLSRVWKPTAGRVNFVLLNPSTADAFTLDPTVRRVLGFAARWGLGALEVTNVFAWRATDPRAMQAASDPVGSGNDAAIVAAALAADLVVVGWGVHAIHRGREEHVRRLLVDAGVSARALRSTKQGHPGHPLYVPASTQLQPWH